MNSRPTHAAFPFIRTTVLLGVTGVLVYVVIMAFTTPSIEMALAVYLSAVLSILPVAGFGRRGVLATMSAWFGGTAMRMVLCLLTVVVLIKSMDRAVAGVVITFMAMYLPMLMVEVRQVTRFLKTSDLPISTETTV